MDGNQALKAAKALDEDLPVILMTHTPEIRGAVAVMRAGAHDYWRSRLSTTRCCGLCSVPTSTRLSGRHRGKNVPAGSLLEQSACTGKLRTASGQWPQRLPVFRERI